MKRYTIPEGYVPAGEIAVGDYVFATFGIDECYHSGPYEVVQITAPRPVQDDYLASIRPDIKARVGEPMVSLICKYSPDAERPRGVSNGPFYLNYVHQHDGVIRDIGGRLWVKQRQQAPVRQLPLFALAG